MELNENTRLEDLIEEYPALRTGMADINPRFKMLQTPMGKIMIKKATVADMSERSGMPVDELVAAIAAKTGLGAADGSASLTPAAEPLPTARAATPAVEQQDELGELLSERPAEMNAEPQVEWWGKVDGFKVIDVRKAHGNFFPGLKKRAEETAVGEGLHIVQSFEPIPLYDVMAELGYEHVVRRGDAGEYHVYFYRAEQGEDSGEIAFRPIALLNFPVIDEELGDVAVNFWNLTWNDEKRYLPQETRLLLSMANALGAGRMRQASRELIKAYAHDCDSRAFDDVFELVAWNQGIGNFASEIGPSTLFRAYRTIKDQEERGVPRAEIVEMLKERFGEQNPDVGVQ